MNEFADTELTNEARTEGESYLHSVLQGGRSQRQSERISIGKWLVEYASSKSELSILDVYHAQCEVDGVAQGRYDWRIERGERNMSL